MTPLGWVCLLIGACGGTAWVVFLLMRSRAEVMLARQREEIATAKAQLAAQQDALSGTIKGAQETTRREAFDEFLADVRVEERHYVREHKMLFLTRKCLVRQERIFLRNIPLTNWVEQEMPLEEGADVEKLAQAMAVFDVAQLASPEDRPVRRLIR